LVLIFERFERIFFWVYFFLKYIYIIEIVSNI